MDVKTRVHKPKSFDVFYSSDKNFEKNIFQKLSRFMDKCMSMLLLNTIIIIIIRKLLFHINENIRNLVYIFGNIFDKMENI